MKPVDSHIKNQESKVESQHLALVGVTPEKEKTTKMIKMTKTSSETPFGKKENKKRRKRPADGAHQSPSPRKGLRLQIMPKRN